ncbi:tetratricopeptide repeat (TPR)-like superfamily protein [Wolffia australiana]
MRRTSLRLLSLLRPSSSRRFSAATFSGERHQHYNYHPSQPISSSSPIHPSIRDKNQTISTDDDQDQDDDQDDQDPDQDQDQGSSSASSENVEIVISSLEGFSTDGAEARKRLEKCGVQASPELVRAVLSRLRNLWSPAFTFFLWSSTQPGYSHTVREYHTMIAILGKMRRFDTAWSLIDEMRRRAILTPKTLILLLRRYAAAREVAKAISTFYALRRFGFPLSIDDFHGLLSALCRYKNVQDAEHLLFSNLSVFPVELKSFNIVLNGWCNAAVSLREAKRFWNEMTGRGFQPDAISYGSLISCCSKTGKLNDVLKVFDKMSVLGVAPDRKVYNSVVHALAMAGFFDRARALVTAMEAKDLPPNAVTFNSLIRGLAKARRGEEARVVFEEMRSRGLALSVRTFHAVMRGARTGDELFETLELMKELGCPPEGDTYVMMIRKLCRWRRHDCVGKLWDEMKAAGGPDRSAYVVLIHGLFLSGRLAEAAKFYEEMKERGFPPEPRTEEMIQAWLSGRDHFPVDSPGDAAAMDLSSPPETAESPGRRPRRRNHGMHPWERQVTRDRGFALLD